MRSRTTRTRMVAVASIIAALTAVIGAVGQSPAWATSSTVLDWGFNNYGYLGNGGTTNVPSPTAVNGLIGITQISAGPGVLALHSDGTVTAWGKNDQGELGNGGTSYRETSPVSVSSLSLITQVSAGGNGFGEALDSNGAVYSWGDNTYAELGRTTYGANDPTPNAVQGAPSGVVQISAGFAHTLALTSSGTVYAWGRNQAGQLGDPTRTASTYIIPFRIPSLSGITQVSANYYDSYALDSSGYVWAWGFDYTSTPTKVSSLPSSILSIAAGYNHALALDNHGNVWAWGSNQYGQIGDGGSAGWRSATKLTSFGTVVSISATNASSFAATTSGDVYAWGVNWFGELGDGTTTNQPTPHRDTALSNIGSVASNSFASFAIPSGIALMAAPTWWHGTTCDTYSNPGSYPLFNPATRTITSYDGVVACGGEGGDVFTNFGGQSVGEYEWECTELVTRYMLVRYGVPPYVADGKDIVKNYPGSIMTKVSNDGSSLPVPGDVLSFDAVYPNNLLHGHTAIVTAVSVSGGAGTITTMEQNNSTNGIGSVPVSGNQLGDGINGWLHHS